jgi:hypothetical protein
MTPVIFGDPEARALGTEDQRTFLTTTPHPHRGPLETTGKAPSGGPAVWSLVKSLARQRMAMRLTQMRQTAKGGAPRRVRLKPMNPARSIFLLTAVLPVMAHAATPSPTRHADIRRALSAAPPAIAAHATVERKDQHGRWIVLRPGDNGWTCIPRSNGDPDPLPACFDANGMAFIRTFATGRSPERDKPGLSYMLRGGSAWSNVDPRASRLPPGRHDYIHIPPHIMILDSRLANHSGLPLHQTDPNTHLPFVMFGGTKQAILIIPVK